MSSEEHRFYYPRDLLSTVPPSVDPKTWAEVVSRVLEVEREKVKAIENAVNVAVGSLKEYFLEKATRISVPAYALVGAVVIASALLTWHGKLGGETFAFLMGTVVGYIISVLSKLGV